MGFIKWPGEITICFGPLIEPENKTAEELLHETQSWIEGRMQKITVLNRFG